MGTAGENYSSPLASSGRIAVVKRTCWTRTEKIASQQVEIKQEGDRMQVATITRGLPVEEGGYHWNGELQLWDNELLMAVGWPSRSRPLLLHMVSTASATR